MTSRPTFRTARLSAALERPARGKRASGFTLLELIIVVAIIGILATIAVPMLITQPKRAKEAVLRTNLLTIRDALKQHYADKGRYPATLEGLVEEKYFSKLPIDPITGSSDSWIPIYEEEDPDDPPAESESDEGPGIIDVASGAAGNTLNGTPYSEL